jgi:hypothetical protein
MRVLNAPERVRDGSIRLAYFNARVDGVEFRACELRSEPGGLEVVAPPLTIVPDGSRHHNFGTDRKFVRTRALAMFRKKYARGK